MTRMGSGFVLAMFAWCGLAAAAVAEPAACPAVAGGARPCDPYGSLSINWENDWFGGNDRHYTNGVRSTYVSPEHAPLSPNWVSTLGRAIPFFPDGASYRYSIAIGQAIFTPEDPARRDLIRDDRPYAGWLYTNLSLLADSGRTFDTLTLSLGVVGPSAKGEEVQNGIHRLIRDVEFEGWDNQLKDEPALLVTYERQWRSPFGRISPYVDYLPHAGVALGNVFTYGAVGGTVRIGTGLGADAGPVRMRPSGASSAYVAGSDGLRAYVFAGVEGRAVLRNIFLDGNTFTDSPSVDKRFFVGDLQIGAAVMVDWPLPMQISYTHVFRSPEFEGQKGTDSFGSLAVTVRF